MRIIVRINIENDSGEEIIFDSLKRWVVDNFSIDRELTFEVSGKDKTLNFDMKNYKDILERNEEKLKLLEKDKLIKKLK